MYILMLLLSTIKRFYKLIPFSLFREIKNVDNLLNEILEKTPTKRDMTYDSYNNSWMTRLGTRKVYKDKLGFLWGPFTHNKGKMSTLLTGNILWVVHYRRTYNTISKECWNVPFTYYKDLLSNLHELLEYQHTESLRFVPKGLE